MSNRNRIAAAIRMMEPRVAGLAKETRDKMDKSTNMSILEHAMFQERKSLLFAEGKINLDEANTIYALLGNTVSVFNKQSLAAKVILTKVFSEML